MISKTSFHFNPMQSHNFCISINLIESLPIPQQKILIALQISLSKVSSFSNMQCDIILTNFFLFSHDTLNPHPPNILQNSYKRNPRVINASGNKQWRIFSIADIIIRRIASNFIKNLGILYKPYG